MVFECVNYSTGFTVAGINEKEAAMKAATKFYGKRITGVAKVSDPFYDRIGGEFLAYEYLNNNGDPKITNFGKFFMTLPEVFDEN